MSHGGGGHSTSEVTGVLGQELETRGLSGLGFLRKGAFSEKSKKKKKGGDQTERIRQI